MHEKTFTNSTEPEVVVREQGSALRITLNRPRAINAISQGMALTLRDVLSTADTRDFSCVIIDGAGDRGLCAGGDIKALFAASRDEARQFLGVEYEADLLTSTLHTPVVAFMTGITMGGGIGISGHAPIRVVTETSILAMPETKAGMAPDVGVNYILAQAPGFIGEYLATTSSSFTAGDAIALGFADFFVTESKLDDLKAALTSAKDPHETVAAFAGQAPDSQLLAQRDWIDECFSADSLSEVLDRLSSRPILAAQETAAQLRQLSPIAVAAAFWAVRLARQDNDLVRSFERDLRIMTTLLDEFGGREGIRALIIDKDHAPDWPISALKDVTVAQLERILGAEVLPLLTQNRV